jgi:hypothetical protein
MAYPAPLPPDVATLAYHRQLGPHVATYLPKYLPSWRLFLLLLFAGGPIGLAVILVVAGQPVIAVLCGLFGVLFLGILLYSPNFSRKLAGRKVYVFAQGFIQAGAAGPVGDYRWDAIASVQQKITERYVNGIHTGTTYLYTVTRGDGAVVKLTQFYEGIAELGQTISREVTRVQLPRAIEAIQHGQTVPFGDLAIGVAGIVSARHGLLPWNELDQVRVVQGYVKLRKAGKWLPWSHKPAAEIPNLFVFLTLADQLQRAAHQT